MAVTAREIILTFRGQNYLSSAIRRVGRDVGGLSRGQQLAAQRASLAVTRGRLQSSLAIAEAERESVRSGTRRVALDNARAGLTRTEQDAHNKLNQLYNAGLSKREQYMTNEKRIADLTRQQAIFNAMSSKEQQDALVAQRVRGMKAAQSGGTIPTPMGPQEVERQLQKAQIAQERLRNESILLTRQQETQISKIQGQSGASRQLAAREAELYVREQQLNEIVQTRSRALDVNTAALDRNAMAMRALPWERFVSGAAAVEHAGRVFQMFGLITAAAFGYAAHSAAQFSTQVTLAATQSTTANNNSTRQVLANAAVLQRSVTQMLARGVTPFKPEELTQTLYTIFSGLSLRGNQMQQLRQGTRILQEFNKVATANYGQVDLNEVTKAGIAIINNFKTSITDLPRVMNRMQASVRFGAMTMGEFTSSLNQVVPAYRGAHYSFDAMAGDIAFVSRLFPSLRVGTTGLSRLVETFGRYNQQISQAIHTNIAPGGRLMPLGQIIRDIVRARPELAKGGVDLQNWLKSVTGNQGTAQARRVFVGIATQLKLYGRVTGDVIHDNNELNKSWQNMSQTPQVRWAEFINQMRVLIMQVGAGAIPAFKAFAAPLVALVRGFNNLSPGMQKAIGYFGAIAAMGALVGGTLVAIAGGLGVIAGRARMMAGFAKGGAGILGLGFGKNAGAMEQEANAASKLIVVSRDAAVATGELGAVTGRLGLMLGGGALFAIAIPVMIRYHTWMQRNLGVSLSLQGALRLVSIAFAVMAARALLSVGAMAAARVGAMELAGTLTALAATSVIQITIAVAAAYALSRAIRDIPHVEGFMEHGGAQVYDAIYGRPGNIKVPSHDAMQRQIAQVNRLYHMYARRGLTPIEIGVRIKADMPNVPGHDLGIFINNAARRARAEAQAAAESGSQRFFHDQPINFAQRTIEAGARDQAVVRQRTLMQRVPGIIATINRLRRASEGYPPNVAKIQRYNAFLKQLETTLKKQPGLYQAITQAADQMFQHTSGITNQAALRETRRLEQMRRQLEKHPSLQGWIGYYKAVDDLNSKMSSAQQQAVQSMLQKNKQAVTKTVNDAKNVIQQIAATITSTFQNFQQQNTNAFGAIGQGPFIQSPRFQNYMQWGGRITGRDLLRDLRSQVSQFRRWRGILRQLSRRGAPFELIQQLEQAGPSAISEAQALLSLNDRDFNQYTRVFREGQRLILQASAADTRAQLTQWRHYGRNIMLAILKGMDENSARFANYFRNLAISLFPDLARRANARPRNAGANINTRGLPHRRTHPAPRHTPTHRAPRYTPPHVPVHPPRPVRRPAAVNPNMATRARATVRHVTHTRTHSTVTRIASPTTLNIARATINLMRSATVSTITMPTERTRTLMTPRVTLHAPVSRESNTTHYHEYNVEVKTTEGASARTQVRHALFAARARMQS